MMSIHTCENIFTSYFHLYFLLIHSSSIPHPTYIGAHTFPCISDTFHFQHIPTYISFSSIPHPAYMGAQSTPDPPERSSWHMWYTHLLAHPHPCVVHVQCTCGMVLPHLNLPLLYSPLHPYPRVNGCSQLPQISFNAFQLLFGSHDPKNCLLVLFLFQLILPPSPPTLFSPWLISKLLDNFSNLGGKHGPLI